MTDSAQPLDLLLEGNERHRKGRRELHDHSGVDDLAAEQRPIAALLTCSDSRISPELIFDVAPGNLFVSRVAGNSVETATLGSTEYAVGVLGVELVVVLGHSDCGAAKAAVASVVEGRDFPRSDHGAIGDVIAPLLPTVESLPPDERTPGRFIPAHAAAQAANLAETGPVISTAVAEGRLRVVAAVYDIADGRVSILEGAGSA